MWMEWSRPDLSVFDSNKSHAERKAYLQKYYKQNTDSFMLRLVDRQKFKKQLTGPVQEHWTNCGYKK